MKSVYKNKSSQKGSSRSIVIIGVVIAVVLLGVVLLSLKGSNRTTPANNNQQTISNQQNQPSLQSENPVDRVKTLYDKIENDSYTFYYPKGYIRADPQKDLGSKNDMLNYKNPNSKAIVPELLVLRILENNQKSTTPDYQSCLGFAESQRKSTSEKIEVKVISEDKFHGCQIKSSKPVDGVNDAVVSKWNWLYYKEQGNDYSIYRVGAVYYSNASRDEIQKLDTAVDLFTLK